MYKQNTRKKNKKLYIVSLASLVILFAFGTILVLEKTGVTNLYRQSDNSSQDGQTSEISSANPTNTVDYSPPKPEDESVIADKNPSTTPTPQVKNELGVTITSTRKNTASTAYLVKAAVVGTDAGSCTAVISKGAKSFTTSGGIEVSAGQYSCMNLEIPLAGINESGTWTIQVTVTDKNGADATATTEVIL